jgi:Ca-activated chloride channel family protein
MLALLLSLILAVSTDQVGTVLRITSPPADVPAFGAVEVAAQLGPENVSHHFRVVATLASGETATAELRTPQQSVDETMLVELRQVYLLANKDGRPVLDLNRSELQLSEDGVPQSLVTFGRGDTPLAAAVLVDASLSMRGERLRGAIAGADAFFHAMTLVDEAALLAHSDRLVQHTPFTNVPEVLLAGVPRIAAGGGSAINDTLYLATTLLGPRQGRRVIVLLSDGVDSHSVLGMEQVLDLLRRSQVQLFWIRLPRSPGAALPQPPSFSSAWRDAAGYRAEIDQLGLAVRDTGGRIIVITAESEVEPAFRTIMKELRDQYVLGFYPDLARRKGSWHRLEVTTTRPGVALSYRAGYLTDS